ncbi:hypothetical protein ACSAZK_17990 [Methanosarcina sp. Mfa9]|uniref:hypothetical protein n=1 Tax=Methanosarcina sp. Mfa9 TaxID=3439063 RepID=UPI003F877D6D
MSVIVGIINSMIEELDTEGELHLSVELELVDGNKIQCSDVRSCNVSSGWLIISSNYKRTVNAVKEVDVNRVHADISSTEN